MTVEKKRFYVENKNILEIQYPTLILCKWFQHLMSVYIALAPAKIDRERIKIVFNMDCREKLLDEYIIHSNHHLIAILLAFQEVT